MTIHDEHPFATPPGDRDPARRLRGRLATPVTILTAGLPGRAVALTVSSIMVAEGDPPAVAVLVGDATDLWYAIEETGTFVVHVATVADRVLADRTAGVVPSPGGPLAGVALNDSEHGPVITEIANRAYCSVENVSEVGWHQLVVARIDRFDLADLDDPLVWFRGTYRPLR